MLPVVAAHDHPPVTPDAPLVTSSLVAPALAHGHVVRGDTMCSLKFTQVHSFTSRHSLLAH